LSCYRRRTRPPVPRVVTCAVLVVGPGPPGPGPLCIWLGVALHLTISEARLINDRQGVGASALVYVLYDYAWRCWPYTLPPWPSTRREAERFDACAGCSAGIMSAFVAARPVAPFSARPPALTSTMRGEGDCGLDNLSRMRWQRRLHFALFSVPDVRRCRRARSWARTRLRRQSLDWTCLGVPFRSARYTLGTVGRGHRLTRSVRALGGSICPPPGEKTPARSLRFTDRTALHRAAQGTPGRNIPWLTHIADGRERALSLMTEFLIAQGQGCEPTIVVVALAALIADLGAGS
jgi:hypothetical protein